MHSQYQVLAHITQCLEQANIAYMLSGSVALLCTTTNDPRY
ncbi:MAG: hypothetical protein PHP00_05645 [Thiotrichaceae bacterium]|nr:hypothetical protein [Thiotrichaceae bacterium]